jgi:hypothetical protein
MVARRLPAETAFRRVVDASPHHSGDPRDHSIAGDWMLSAATLKSKE